MIDAAKARVAEENNAQHDLQQEGKESREVVLTSANRSADVVLQGLLDVRGGAMPGSTRSLEPHSNSANDARTHACPCVRCARFGLRELLSGETGERAMHGGR